ncbi:hypothetical protein YC2023_056831 [Brassica napus]
MILYSVLRQLIGRKSEMAEAPGRLGTNARIVEFVETGMKEYWKKWVIEERTSTPRKLQDDL